VYQRPDEISITSVLHVSAVKQPDDGCFTLIYICCVLDGKIHTEVQVIRTLDFYEINTSGEAEEIVKQLNVRHQPTRKIKDSSDHL